MKKMITIDMNIIPDQLYRDIISDVFACERYTAYYASIVDHNQKWKIFSAYLVLNVPMRMLDEWINSAICGNPDIKIVVAMSRANSVYSAYCQANGFFYYTRQQGSMPEFLDKILSTNNKSKL